MRTELLTTITNSRHSVGLQTSFLPNLGISIVAPDFIDKAVRRIARMASNEGAAPSSAPKTGRRIMVVDDEKDI